MDSDFPRKLNDWYTAIAKSARWMDIIGDYAGDELFIIDGESLLQTVLNDELLAIGQEKGCGFQIVHALYILETLLENFTTRNANIEIVFFKFNKYPTLRPGAGAFVASSRALARKLLQNHLKRLPIPVFYFTDLDDPRWLLHEASAKPMFVLLNDRCRCEDSDNHNERYQMYPRHLIFKFVKFGLPIALLNGIEFHDSKVLTFVLEYQRTNHSLQTRALETPPALDDIPTNSSPAYSADRKSCLAQACRAILSQSAFKQGDAHQQRALLFMFILHIFVLDETPLEMRALPSTRFPRERELLLKFLPIVFFTLTAAIGNSGCILDIDINIFVSMLRYLSSVSLDNAFSKEAVSFTADVWKLAGAGPRPDFSSLKISFATQVVGNEQIEDDLPSTKTLLPFSHPVLDNALASIHVTSASNDEDILSPYFDFSQNGVMFTDSHHWHNHKELVPSGRPQKLSWRSERAQQRFMKTLQNQAETLTGALGRGLQQITIVSKPVTSNDRALKASKPQPQKGKKKAPTKKELMQQKITEERIHKKDEENRQWFLSRLKDMDKLTIAQKLVSIKSIRNNSRCLQSQWLAMECHIYALHLTMLSWMEHPTKESDSVRDENVATILQQLQSLGPLSTQHIAAVASVLNALGLEDYQSSLLPMDSPGSSPMTFKFVKLQKSSQPLYPWMQITEHPIRWQLRLFGSFMDRSMGGAYDARVDFQPDEWQRQALDCIDDPNHSMLVVAPTSAGKTFISFYAMEKVLRESNDGILVYIAPTKALVNQIAAEVYARFKKTLSKGTMWAIHTRDYRIHDPQNCQILVTVPEMLAIMLLSPPLARKWHPRIKRIILDEIHTIGQQEGGAVWEQIILLAPCPIIGLSATVGSPDRFNDWLKSVANANGWKHSFIQHKHRYSHLRKFCYNTSNDTDLYSGETFQGLSSSRSTDRLCFLHPIAMLSFGNRALPDDLALEAQDTLTLFDAIAVACPSAPGVDALNPIRFFASTKGRLLKQADILRYEAALKEFITHLSRDPQSQPSSVLKKITSQLEDPKILQNNLDEGFKKTGLLTLAVDLHRRDLLPAIFFSFDRYFCERIAIHLLEELTAAEEAWKQSSPEWRRKLEEWERWKDAAKTRERHQEKMQKSQRKKDNEAPREDPADTSSWESTFDPDAPLPDFSFVGRCNTKELQDDIDDLWNMKEKSWEIQALRRGIAVHHAGMKKQYRSLIENLFRRGIIRIMISTGTLALGINAPTRTSVFCGDSPFLTALMYRQCAGRAGRRGYDLLGNVVFYGLPIQRVQRLVLSRLPSLGGTFPLTTTLTLRLLNLLHGSQNAEVTVKAIQSLMELPQITFGSSIGRTQLLHHLRFNIEYLRRTRLIDEVGVPINLYAVGAHLYYTEPSNFAFVVLLHSGILHRISTVVNPEREYICLMSQLFGRRYLPGALVNSPHLLELKRKYPSMIELEPIREDARAILARHNDEVRDIFATYVSTYARQYASELGPDNVLPLSKICYSPTLHSPGGFIPYLRHTARRVNVRSQFVATSGHFDEFGSAEEIARSVRRGIHLNVHAIPNMQPFIAQGEHVLNAYLLDFFTHGQVKTLENANGIRRGDVWYYLQDFMLTLMTIKTSLQQFLLQVSDAEEGSAVSGEQEDEEDDETVGEDTFTRPAGVSNADWRLYMVVRDATAQFDEKYRSMWA